ncbi:MAG: hypothetical protein QOE90_2715 [Thermoplasmata archaeon]|nr:hypothetical protein [Thermoplasmata archaeon]
MNVLVATPYLAPQGGGLERYAAAIGQGLARQGHRVVELGHAPAAFDERGGTRRVGVPIRWRLSNTPLAPRYRSEARRLIREERIDVVLAHTPVPGAAEMAALAARREGVPYVVTYHAGRLEAPRGSPLRLAAWAHRAGFERALLSRAAARIAVSPYVARNVFGVRPSVVIPPGVDAMRFRPGREETPGRVLFVGPLDRAYAWKGLSTLVEALDRLPGAHLRLVGAGDLAERYRKLPRVEVAGRVDDDQLVEEYQRASVLVLPSTSAAESFGMVLAEANACGRPVVGSRVGGIPFFVRDGENGLLAAPGDAADLAAKIGRLLGDADLRRRLGEAGRARVLAEHRWDALAKETAAVLEQAVTGASAPAARRSSP